MQAPKAGRLLVLAITATACLATPDTPPPAEATTDPGATAAGLAALPAREHEEGPGPTVRRWEAGRRAGDPGEVVAAAVTDVAEQLAVARWASVEGIDWPGPGAAVVTFLLVGPDGTAAGSLPDEATVTRIAVAVLLDGHRPRATGDHWVLPQPEQATAVPWLEPLVDDDARRSALTALTAAGLAPEHLVGLSQATDRWPVVAHLREPDGRDRNVWLRWLGHGLVVAGSSGQPGATS